MTVTETDLRLALTAKADESSEPAVVLDALLARAHPRRPVEHRRVSGSAILVAATVAAVATAASVVASVHHRTRVAPSVSPAYPAAPARFDPHYFLFDLAPVDGFHAVVLKPGSDAQTMVVATGAVKRASITLFPAGRTFAGRQTPFDPSNATPTAVQGHSGFLTTSASGTSLEWKYAPNAWATVNGGVPYPQPLSAADALRLAAAVRPASRTTMLIPVRIGSLPDGQRLQAIATGPIPDAKSGGALLYLGTSPHNNNELNISVEGPELRASFDAANQPGVPVRVGNLSGWWRQDTLILLGPTYVLILSALPNADSGHVRLTEQELISTARSITVAADVADTSTWFPAPSAVL